MFKNRLVRVILISVLLISVGLVYGAVFGAARVYNYQANLLYDEPSFDDFSAGRDRREVMLSGVGAFDSAGNLRDQSKPDLEEYHYSFYRNREFFDQAFAEVETGGEVFLAEEGAVEKLPYRKAAIAAISDQQDDELVYGLLVNHHLFARNLIAQAFEAVKTDEKRTVVLISPNHFARGDGRILLSKLDWKVPYGVLEADEALINALLLDGRADVRVDERPFQEEHGVTGLVAFIKKVMPQAKIVPVIVKDDLSYADALEFAQVLNERLPQDALVVGSFDFSHYLPDVAADFHDEKSLAVINNVDRTGTEFLDIDSRPGLQILLEYLSLRSAARFDLLGHSSSAEIVSDKDTFENTSYIVGTFTKGESRGGGGVTILGFGDMMLDRYVKKAIDKNSVFYPFEHIARFLGGNDITLVNMEGPVTDFVPRRLDPNNTTFTFSSTLLPALRSLGMSLFNLANNHTRDFGQEGYDQTRKYLRENGFAYYGDNQNNEDLSFVTEVREMKIGSVGYNQYRTSNFENVLAEIKRLRPEVDFLIVTPHWGFEYQSVFAKSQQEQGRQMIDAGADAVLGHHPHVIQPIEIYNGKPIFYSLGNFLFDQTFSVATQRGLGVGLVVKEGAVDYYLFPIQIDNFQIKLLSGTERERILQDLIKHSVADDAVKEEILAGKISL